jgi:membrane protease YdiL (CAAX protease family)
MAAPEGTRVAVSLAAGISLGAIVVATTPTLVERTTWARSLHAEMKPLLEALSSLEIRVLALTSGVAEELFFRGAMQPVVGLVVTSLVFGAVHTGPKRAFVAWSIWAFVMGLSFGLIFEATGSLWGPILAHVLINDRNLTFLKSP